MPAATSQRNPSAGDLVAEDDLVRCRAAQHDHDVRLLRQLAEQREDGRGAHADPDEQETVALRRGRLRRGGDGVGHGR